MNFECVHCSNILDSIDEIEKHEKFHQLNRCCDCGKQLSSQNSLNRHMLVHTGIRSF